MPTRLGFALTGLFVGLGLDVVVNLIAAAIQQRLFSEQFSNQALWLLAGLAIAFALLGFWLGGQVPNPAARQPTDPAGPP